MKCIAFYKSLKGKWVKKDFNFQWCHRQAASSLSEGHCYLTLYTAAVFFCEKEGGKWGMNFPCIRPTAFLSRPSKVVIVNYGCIRIFRKEKKWIQR